MENNIGIYIIKNNIDDRVYIGSSINLKKRFYAHINSLRNKNHHNTKLQNFVNKYGLNVLLFEIICNCSKHELIKLEQFYIDKFNAYIKGFNCSPTAGNILNFKMSNESKMKISKALKKHKRTEEHCKSLSNAQKNKPKLFLRGLKRTPEQIKNISQGQLNSKKAIEAKKKNRKPIIQFTKNGSFVKNWESIKQISEELKIDASNIVKVLKNKKLSAYGFVWKYSENLEKEQNAQSKTTT